MRKLTLKKSSLIVLAIAFIASGLFVSDVKALSSDATLSVFTIGGENVLGLPEITGTGAELEVPASTTLTGVTVTENDPNASSVLLLNGAIVPPPAYLTLSVEIGDIVEVDVTAEDGTTQTYKVTVVQAKSSDATLSTFTIGTEDVIALSGVTDPSGTELEVASGTTLTGITAITNDSKASAKILLNGNIVIPPLYSTLEVGIGDTVEVEVTAEDGDSQVYKLTVALDTTPPVITLIGNATVNLTVGDSYTDEGATAEDNVDGNLTDSIAVVNPVDTSAADTYIITYNVSDSSGNPAVEVTRTVNVSEAPDIIAPEITLLGDNPVNLYVGDPYADAGATALDDADGDITADIVVAGDTVDTATAGTYIITYNVSDSSGNPAVEVTRTVIVSAPPSPPPSLLPSGGGAHFDTTAASISGDIDIRAGSRSATITWKTNESSISWVVYGETTAYGNEVKTTNYITSHSVILENLSPSATYHYQVKTKDRSDNVRAYNGNFTTLSTGDVNGDTKIDKYDFALMMAAWGQTGANHSDLNGDDKVDKYDFSLLMANWSAI